MSTSISSNEPASPDSRKVICTVGAAFATLVFVAYFRRFAEFGFYSDDAAFFGGAANRTWSEALAHLAYTLTNWPQGRPLGMGLNLSFVPYLIINLGGLPLLHLFAWLILSTNMLLIWGLVRRVAPPLVAFAAGGFYGLCPAHTVQTQLVWAYNSQIAMLCAFGAIYSAGSNRWIIYGLLVAAATLMAEPAAMVALAGPGLFALRPNRVAFRRVVISIAIWILIVGIILVARKLIGDPAGQERVGEIASNPVGTIVRSFRTAYNGPTVHLQLVAERLAMPLKELDLEVLLTAALAASVAVVGARILTRFNPRKSFATDGRLPDIRHPTVPSARECLVCGAGLMCFGILVMAFVYASFFRDPWYPANWRAGFMSGVHLVAVSGSCLLFAGIIWLFGSLGKWSSGVQIAVVATVFSLFSGFGVLVQRDYAGSWAFQRSFWQVYQRLCPQADNRTFVLVLDRELPTFRFVDRSSWTTEVLPGGLFDYQASGNDANKIPWRIPAGFPWVPPSVIFVAPNPADTIKWDGDHYSWKSTYYFMLPKSSEQRPESGNVIILDHSGGSWRRLTGEVPVEGGSLRLKPEPLQTGTLPLKPLASLYGL